MSTPSNDCEQLESFLRRGWGIEGYWILFWGRPSKRSHWVQHIDDAVINMLLEWATREDVYVGCGFRSRNLGPTLRGESSDVAGIPGIWLDVDYGKDHKKPNRPPDEAAAHELIAAMGPPPSLTFHSGHGVHVWWFFKEPWIFESNEDRAKAEHLTKGWNTTLAAHAASRGWSTDSVGDLARIMRMPGTWNRKSVPVRTRLLAHAQPEVAYNPSELEGFLRIDLIEDREPLPDMDWKFDMHPHANPPVDQFIAACANDYLFERSWNHQRPDLHDQSASGYDLSLATRAMMGGWAVQGIVDLLIAHRRKHGADLKLRRDYFTLTLNKAAKHRVEEQREERAAEFGKGKELPDEIKNDPAEIKAILSKRLSTPSGQVEIGRVLRFKADPIVYEIEINGFLVHLGPIDKLTGQRTLRNTIATNSRVWPKEQPKAVWDRIVQALLDTAEDVDAGVEATARGSLEQMLETYLSEGVESPDRWEQAIYENIPACRDGRVLFTLNGFADFLRARYQERVSPKKLAVEFTSLGYQRKEERVHNRRQKRGKRMTWWKPE